MKVGSLEQEVTLGAWGLLPDSDYIISIRAKNEKVRYCRFLVINENDRSWSIENSWFNFLFDM